MMAPLSFYPSPVSRYSRARAVKINAGCCARGRTRKHGAPEVPGGRVFCWFSGGARRTTRLFRGFDWSADDSSEICVAAISTRTLFPAFTLCCSRTHTHSSPPDPSPLPNLQSHHHEVCLPRGRPCPPFGGLHRRVHRGIREAPRTHSICPNRYVWEEQRHMTHMMRFGTLFMR